jgi:hypothetical protein
VHARRAIKNASSSKVSSRVYTDIQIYSPKEVPRDTASKVHTLVYEGASLFVNVLEGQPFETIDDLVAPHPTTFWEDSKGNVALGYFYTI